MDFRNRNSQNAQQAHNVPVPAAPGHTAQEMPTSHHNDRDDRSTQLPKWLRIANVVMLFSITVLALSIALLMRNGNPNEQNYVIEDKYQAVFLENGQVYFGKIAALNSRFIDLQGVFYLNSQSKNTDTTEKATTASDQFTLIKLGCELHGPYDQMVINRDQVTFWENLKADGQVVKTIKEWAKQNPNGQKCSTSTGSTEQSNATTQSASGTSTTNTGTTSTTNKQQ